MVFWGSVALVAAAGYYIAYSSVGSNSLSFAWGAAGLIIVAGTGIGIALIRR